MTQGKAAAVLFALVNAGYVPSVSTDAQTPANYTISVSVNDGVAAQAVASFAAGQSVTATVPSVVFA